MTDGWIFGPELKPWEKLADNNLHGADYAAAAVFSVAEMTYKHLYALNGAAPTGLDAATYAKLFAGVLIRAQSRVGPGGWSSMLNARLRGALYTALEITPEEDFSGTLDEYAAVLEQHVVNIAKTAAWLYGLPARELAGA